MSDDNPLRALTVKQPHAWAIVHGSKDVENRTWRFPYELGMTIAIHAGLKEDPDGLRVPLAVPEGLPRGAVVGFVDVVDSHEGCSLRCSPWAAPGHHHWRLANPRVLDEPIPTRGFLWLFTPPPDVTSRLLDALGR